MQNIIKIVLTNPLYLPYKRIDMAFRSTAHKQQPEEKPPMIDWCKFQEKQRDWLWKCYTQKEWDTKQETIALQDKYYSEACDTIWYCKYSPVFLFSIWVVLFIAIIRNAY